MIEWSEQHSAIRDMVRRFVESEIAPKQEELEHGDTPPYELLRKMVKTFGLDEVARARFFAGIKKEQAREAAHAGEKAEPKKEPRGPSPEAGDELAMQLIPIIELSRYSPGMVTALGVSMGLTASAILTRGTTRQKETF